MTHTCHESLLQESWYEIEMDPHPAVCIMNRVIDIENRTVVIVSCVVFGAVVLLITGIILY